MPVIAAQGPGAYPRDVLAALFRLLAIAGLVLMPLGMGATPAAAMTAHQASADGEGHCGGQPSEQGGKAWPSLHCVAGCTALPAEVPSLQEPAAARVLLRAEAPVRSLVGATIPPATPPPRGG